MVFVRGSGGICALDKISLSKSSLSKLGNKVLVNASSSNGGSEAGAPKKLLVEEFETPEVSVLGSFGGIGGIGRAACRA